jgi:hypothetical protein
MIRPFDLILFYGGNIPSKTILKAQKFHMIYLGHNVPYDFLPEWSHVGIAINNHWLNINNSKEDEIYIWESTYSGELNILRRPRAPDIESGKNMLGVQIRKLEDVIKSYITKDEKIAVLKLKPIYRKIIEYEIDILRPKIQKYHRDNYHQKYEDILPLTSTVIPFLRRYRNKNNKKLFCSELAANIYKILGLINYNEDPRDIKPSDFTYPHYSANKINIFEFPWIYINKDTDISLI